MLSALDESLATLRGILTAEQWRKLPEAVRVFPRELVPPNPTARVRTS